MYSSRRKHTYRCTSAQRMMRVEVENMIMDVFFDSAWQERWLKNYSRRETPSLIVEKM